MITTQQQTNRLLYSNWLLHSTLSHNSPVAQETATRALPSQPPEESGPSVGMTVIAEYEYTPLNPQDLELRSDEEYTILEIADLHWWKARDKYG